MLDSLKLSTTITRFVKFRTVLRLKKSRLTHDVIRALEVRVQAFKDFNVRPHQRASRFRIDDSGDDLFDLEKRVVVRPASAEYFVKNYP